MMQVGPEKPYEDDLYQWLIEGIAPVVEPLLTRQAAIQHRQQKRDTDQKSGRTADAMQE